MCSTPLNRSVTPKLNRSSHTNRASSELQNFREGLCLKTELVFDLAVRSYVRKKPTTVVEEVRFWLKESAW